MRLWLSWAQKDLGYQVASSEFKENERRKYEYRHEVIEMLIAKGVTRQEMCIVRSLAEQLQYLG
jgi:hypothetical protein